MKNSSQDQSKNHISAIQANPNYAEEITMNEDSTYLIAGHPQTLGKHLELLATSASSRVRRRVAEHPNCPIHVLMLLAKDADPEVRMNVVNNANVPFSILEQLADDQSDDVRFYLAEDHSLPRTLLMKLIEDENPFVATRAQLTFVRAAQSKLLDQSKFNSNSEKQKVVATRRNDGLRFSAHALAV